MSMTFSHHNNRDWLETHGEVKWFQYDHATLFHTVMWASNGGHYYSGTSETEIGAYDSLFVDIKETLFGKCQ